MERIPVHIVRGASGSGKSALIARLCGDRSDWLGLVNTLSVGALPNLRLLSSGCPCCTGKVVLQITLARALRQTRAVRAFVELSDPEHAETLAGLLGEPPLSLSLLSSRPIVLSRDAELHPAELEG